MVCIIIQIVIETCQWLNHKWVAQIWLIHWLRNDGHVVHLICLGIYSVHLTILRWLKQHACFTLESIYWWLAVLTIEKQFVWFRVLLFELISFLIAIVGRSLPLALQWLWLHHLKLLEFLVQFLNFIFFLFQVCLLLLQLGRFILQFLLFFAQFLFSIFQFSILIAHFTFVNTQFDFRQFNEVFCRWSLWRINIQHSFYHLLQVFWVPLRNPFNLTRYYLLC